MQLFRFINGVLSPFLRDQYTSFFNRAQVKPNAVSKVKQAYDRLIANKSIYEQIAKGVGNLPGVTWYLIGCIHMRECSFRLDQHLANGDPLTGKTRRVPAGLPTRNLRPGERAYPFVEMGIVAINRMLTSSPAWRNHKNDASVESLLLKLEAFNGFGYLNNNRLSPYLWSDSTVEQVGKYTSDGVFNPNVKDAQLGAGTLLKYYLEEEKKKQTSNWSYWLFNFISGG